MCVFFLFIYFFNKLGLHPALGGRSAVYVLWLLGNADCNIARFWSRHSTAHMPSAVISRDLESARMFEYNKSKYYCSLIPHSRLYCLFVCSILFINNIIFI